MSLRELLYELSQKKISLWVEDDRLRVRGEKGQLTPELQANIKSKKDELRDWYLKQQYTITPVEPIRPISREDLLPLSYAQKRLWFLDKLDSHSASYNLSFLVRFEGGLNVDVLEKSLNYILNRHEALRANFSEDNGAPLQIIRPMYPHPLKLNDLSNLSIEQAEIELTNLVSQEAKLIFDMSTDSLVRWSLIRVNKDKYALLLTMHHIISDAWSFGIFINELVTIYDAYLVNSEPSLQNLEIQYVDYATWQNKWLSSDIINQQLTYWKKHLDGACTVLDLPTDKPRPAIQTYNGSTFLFEISSQLLKQLNDLSVKQSATLFMTLLSVFSILMGRYSQQKDILIGSPMANRKSPEVDSLIGFFVNTIIFRADLSNNPSFTTVLKRIKQTCLGGYNHQDIPFEKIVDELQIERDLSRSALFQVMFSLQNTPMDSSFKLSGVKVSHSQIPTNTSNFDLTMDVTETEGQLQGVVEYNPDLFNKETIARLVTHFSNLLESIVSEPEQKLSELSVLSPAERHQQLIGWRGAQRTYPRLCLHQAFEEQVERSPTAIAAVDRTQSLSYQALNERANQLAHTLRETGVGVDVLVGLCAERSCEMLVGILGILKAGGVYVPMDPSYPEARLHYMLRDARCSMLLTQSHLLNKVKGALSSTSIICLDLDLSMLADSARHNPDIRMKARHRAYMIYTSGSTGQPKGALIHHAGALNHIYAQYDALQLGEGFNFLQSAPASSDISVWQFLGPLLCGGKTVILDDVTDVARLFGVIRDESVTVIELVPVVMQLLLTHIESLTETEQRLPALRWMMATGEAVSVELVNAWLHQYPAIPVVNAYGPTEASDDISQSIISEPLPVEQSNVPVGRPLANLSLYVLDNNLQLQPIGVPGEICVSGVGVGEGYWNNQEKTEKSFINNPFTEGYGDVIYRTGDLGRWLADGQLECLGRIDHQVNIRGHRIELGEIESSLIKHESIQDAAVIVQDEQGHKRLIGYVIPMRDSAVETGELQEYLAQCLPGHMIPHTVISLDAFPLTPAGKVDRKGLPVAEMGASETIGYVAPRTDRERILASIWSDVLGLDKVGIHDNFFELGGDSILSIQIISRSKRAGLQLTPKQIFAHQSIVELAVVAEEGTSSINAEQGRVTGDVQLTPIQQWFFDEGFNEAHHWNQSIVLALDNDTPAAHINTVLNHLVVHHDALRLRYKAEASHWLQWHEERDSEIVLQHADLSELTGAAQQQALEAHMNRAQQSLNLNQGPLFYSVLYQLSQTEQRLFIAIHHLVVDGVSWRILLEDLQTGLKQLSAGKPIKLPAKTSSFQCWSSRLQQYAQSEVMNQEKAYWLDKAKHTQAIKTLPQDNKTGSNKVSDEQQVIVSLGADKTRALLQRVNRAYQTEINDILLSALLLALNDWTGESEQLITLEGHGREYISDAVDVSRTVGWFTSEYPVHLQTAACGLDAQDLGGVIKSVKEQLRSIPNQGLGYGVLRYLSDDEGVRQALAQTGQTALIFNYLGQFDSDLRPDVSLQSHRSHVLMVDGLVRDGCLHLAWSYSQSLHHKQTIELLADRFIEILGQLIEHCQQPGTLGYTPSDFPLSGIDQLSLDRLVQDYGKIDDLYPLSPVQEGMLFHGVYDPDSVVYFEQQNITLQGELNLVQFEQSWQQVYARHPVLLSRFLWQGLQRPLQCVHPVSPLPIVFKDWRSIPHVEIDQRLTALLKTDREQGFKFDQIPLMRLTLISLPDKQHQLIWSYHHILLDGWSTAQVLSEVFQTYQALSQSQSLQLPIAPAYGQFIHWLGQQDQVQAEHFWRDYLQGFEAPIKLGMQISRGKLTDQSMHHEEVSAKLPVTLSRQFDTFTQTHHLTVNTILQGAWALLLSRYSGESDIVFGCTVSGRPAGLNGVEEMVGLFINTLPLRVSVNYDMPLLEWLAQLQNEQIELRQYEYSPLSSIQKICDVSAGHALFDSILVFESYPVNEGLKLQDSALSICSVDSFERTNYPLELAVVPGEALSLRIYYDMAQFEGADMERMLRHLQILLTSIVSEPEQKLSELSVLSPAERHQQLIGWRGAQRTYPRLCLHQAFEEQVERSPTAIAAVDRTQSLSYQALNERANQLAHTLRETGVGVDVLVGLCAERSCEMLVGILGILKAGGVYVPMDPSYPEARLHYMLRDARCSMLLTQSHLLNKVKGALSSTSIICLDLDLSMLADSARHNPDIRMKARHRAYMIYTSGSTGQPKGALIHHAGALNHIYAQYDALQLGEGFNFLQSAPASSDISVWQFLGPLLCGGKTVILDDVTDVARLFGVIRDESVTVIELVPVVMQLLLTHIESLTETEQRLPALRWMMATGEAVSVELVNAWLHQYPAIPVVNAYGPTEASDDISQSIISEPLPVEQSNVPVGRPLANLSLYVLDNNLQLQPIGVPGEICVSGVGVGEGYWNNQEKTEKSFINNPFTEGYGDVIYRTGDLGRWLADGQLECLGRIDHQVNIRGHRIELGEIESSLIKHESIQDAAVIVQDEQGHKRLIGYVIPMRDSAVETGELQEYLAQCLPGHMIPHTVISLDAFPLTPAGKVDRKGLPVAEMGASETIGYVAPRTDRERILASIWSDVLGLDKVGIHDNFFELGGDSILSIQIISRSKRAGLQLTPKQIFAHQSIVELAVVAEEGTSSINAEQGRVTGDVQLTPIQQWFFDEGFNEAHHWNQSIVLALDNDTPAAHINTVLNHLVVHHDALRLRYKAEASHWLQWHEERDSEIVLQHADLSELTGAAQQQALEAHMNRAQQSLNLNQGPLFYSVLYQLSQTEQRLFIAIHHLVVDGVSWRILLEDLQTGLKQLSAGKPIKLPAKTSSFQCWSSRLQQYAQSEVMNQEKAYWLDKAKHTQAIKTLPQDNKTGSNKVSDEQQVIVSLGADKTRALLQRVNRAYQTEINDILLSALLLALNDWTGESEQLITLEGHGREYISDAVDVSRTVGWFTSEYPVHLQTAACGLDAQDLGGVIKSVKEQLRSIPNQGLGYGVLRYLSDDEGVRQALAQTGQTALIFNYLGQFDSDLRPDVSLQSHRSHVLMVDGLVRDGCLHLAWSYSQSLHHKQTIELLADRFIEILGQLIEHCQQPGTLGYTPSDFPLSGIDQLSLDRLVQDYGKIDDLYPLSPVQEGMIFHSLYKPGLGVYVEQLVFDIRGDVNENQFISAWKQLVYRHDILRTTFILKGQKKPLQCVKADQNIIINKYDWQNEAQQKSKLFGEFLAQDSLQGFDLSIDPPLRFSWIKLSNNQYQVIISYHHAILDGWSVSSLFTEFLSIYKSVDFDSQNCVKAANQYKKFITWLANSDQNKSELYWRTYLKDYSSRLTLPFSKNNIENNIIQERELVIGEALTADLQQLCRNEGITLNTLMQGVWCLLLGSYCNETDIVFGVTVSGRPANLSGVEDILGLFINTIPLRVKIEKNSKIIVWLKELQKQQLESRKSENVSLVNIQKWSDIPDGQSLFDSIFVYENYPVRSSINDIGLDFSINKAKIIEHTNYPLALTIFAENQLNLNIAYDSGRFDSELINDILNRIQLILKDIVNETDRPISGINLLTQDEKHKLVFQWNDTDKDYARSKCVHELFETQVEKTPDDIAVEYEDVSITYRELNAKANQLATHLQTLGVKQESMIAVRIDRSINMVVALIGVLKTGAAYVPIDPMFPTSRVSYMLENSNAKVLLTQSHLIREGESFDSKTVLIDDHVDEYVAYLNNNLRIEVSPQNIAYTIYTSGSTGQPKGVQVPHTTVNNFLSTMIENPGINSNDAVLNVTSISFDIAVLEIFAPLMVGGKVCVASSSTINDAYALSEYIKDANISVMQATPSTWRMLLNFNWRPAKGLKVLCGGEPLVNDLAKKLSAENSPVWNMYGPTETTVWSAMGEVAIGDELISIGRPVGNTQIYILDSNLNLVIPGVAGELCIAGEGLARGYLGRPDLTAECFVANPFKNGERIYRTGDMARYLADGNIECLGRRDNQVKIRGYRIEVGEIEKQLNKNESISESVVISRENQMGEKQLEAFIVTNNEYELKGNVLQEYLKKKLPQFMVPVEFYALSFIPLTPNGKVDRNAILEHESTESRIVRDYVEPCNQLENDIADMWQQVLGVDKVGVEDDFFELGGHSLKAMQLMMKIEENLNKEISIQAIFSHPTVKQIAFFLSHDEELIKTDEIVDILLPWPKKDLADKKFSTYEILVHIRFLLSSYLMRIPGIVGALAYLVAKKTSRQYANKMRIKLPIIYAKIFFKINNIRVNVRNLNYFDDFEAKPVVLFVNHNSRLDSEIIQSIIPMAFSSFRSDEDNIALHKIKILEWMNNVFDLTFMHYKNSPEKTEKEYLRATEFVNKGNALLVFPEGSFGNGSLKVFGEINARLAIEAGAYIIPITILDSAELRENNKWVFKSGTVNVVVSKPVDAKKYDLKQSNYLANSIRSEVLTVLLENFESNKNLN